MTGEKRRTCSKYLSRISISVLKEKNGRFRRNDLPEERQNHNRAKRVP